MLQVKVGGAIRLNVNASHATNYTLGLYLATAATANCIQWHRKMFFQRPWFIHLTRRWTATRVTQTRTLKRPTIFMKDHSFQTLWLHKTSLYHTVGFDCSATILTHHCCEARVVMIVHIMTSHAIQSHAVGLFHITIHLTCEILLIQQ